MAELTEESVENREQKMKDEFTLSDEIDSLVGGDDTNIIMGFVDGIESLRKVGKHPPLKSIFKFILNNDKGKRIRIVMWEDKADLYEDMITYRTIVRITRGVVVPIKALYYKESENIGRNEITVTRCTKIDLLGKYGVRATIKRPTTFKKIELNMIADSSDGPVYVEGFIKMAFISQKSGYSTYGTGAITDGKFQLRIQIGEHVPDEKLIEGTHVRVQGSIKKDKYGTHFLQVQDMADIKIFDKETMPLVELRKGFRRSMKRELESVKENECKSGEKKTKTV